MLHPQRTRRLLGKLNQGVRDAAASGESVRNTADLYRMEAERVCADIYGGS